MAKRKKRSVGRGIMLTLLAVPLICVLTACLCGVALAAYIGIYVAPNADIDVSSYSMDLSSIIYAKDPETGEYVEYETLTGEENRIWADLEEIPKDLQNAVIAIEDKRFYSHKGVDWLRTFNASLGYLTGGDEGGGSTLTQQLIKNLTGNNDRSVKRKINEIFQALRLEKNLGADAKDQILELYLNTISYGNRSGGVKVAAMTYFGKELNELNLAECAVLAAIPNAPSYYNPFRNPDHVKERQEKVLYQMLDQGFITQAEYDEACATELVYRNEEYQQSNASPYSWFTDAVIEDVINDLMAKEGISRDLAESKVMGGGLQIYATIDQNVQNAMDAVYTNEDYFPNASKNGEVPQSAMVICDKQGNILGLVGGRGEKQGSRINNRATQAVRQPGSSIKPIAVYGPAMDANLITPYTVLTDMPFMVYDGKPWPRNDNRRYQGQMTIQRAVAKSINCIAVRTLDLLTPAASYEFLTDTLGFTHLNSVDMDYSPLALGGTNGGVTVREMAGAYTIFANNGMYSGSRTYTQVLDHDGNVVLDNTPEEKAAFQNEKTVYYMLDCLTEVTSSGTATSADLGNIATAGKTGTTSSKNDVWFCGLTPYYVGATWFGYDKSYDLSDISGNRALMLWTEVMERVHADLPAADFDMGDDDDFVYAEYCLDSGLRPTDACSADSRGSRVATGRFYKGDQPTESCNLHKYVSICSESGLLAGDNCPEDKIMTASKLDLTRMFPMSISTEIEDSYMCYTGSNAPVGEGDVVVSGGSLGTCNLTHLLDNLFPFDPELGGNGENPEDPGTDPEGGETPSDGSDPETGGEETGTGFWPFDPFQ